jgi:hypothetical protein
MQARGNFIGTVCVCVRVLCVCCSVCVCVVCCLLCVCVFVDTTRADTHLQTYTIYAQRQPPSETTFSLSLRHLHKQICLRLDS